MHWTRPGRSWLPFAAFVACHLLLTGLVRGQFNSASETLLINASSATTWTNAGANIVQLQGPVSISMDRVHCTAKSAVIWLSPQPGGLLDEQNADIVLIGDAMLASPDNSVTRSGPQLLVNAVVRGSIQLTAPSRVSQNLSASPLYLEADAIRTAGESGNQSTSGEGPAPPLTTTSNPPPPAPGGTSAAGVVQPRLTKAGFVVLSHAGLLEQVDATDGTSALQIRGGVALTQTAATGNFIELQADSAVIFTDVRSDQMKSPGDLIHHITAAYLEGDVRITYTPAAARQPEQRITADRVYYDFATQRAVLTDVILHAVDPTTQIPITIRANIMHQLSQGEYDAEDAQFTTSKFAVPTYSVRSNFAYVHTETDQPGAFQFQGQGNTFNVMGVPAFYWPSLSGTVTNQPFPLRNFQAGGSSRYGFVTTSEWGLFETLGRPVPKDMDIDYRLDYFSNRGIGGGFDGTYNGGFITDEGNPWDFLGDFKAFLMSDKGVDELGGIRTDVTPPTETRGRFLWEHEQFLPDDWQIQLRVGYVSDPTFDEEYYQPDFDTALPYNASFYVKHQQDNDALTFLAETDTTNFITNAASQPNQFDVARLPEISYQNIGDSVLDDQLSLYSNNSASALKFDQSHYSLEQQGFYPGLSPGIPSAGYTGMTNGIVYRGDTRQEVDWPFSLGEVRFVPYIMGRATVYSSSPEDTGQQRLFGGTGLRLTTNFWETNDSIDSDLLDLHRLRHVVEPEINLYTSATTVDQSKLYIFDPNVDAINDIDAAQFALHQHWETMRGGPGRWESVDLLDVDVEGDFYAHQPPPSLLNPVGFRGLFFPSEPETSVPRQAVNGDVTWHIGDDTAFISDAQWNMDQHELAVAEAGISVTRGSRLNYYIGDAYVQALESQVLTVSAGYNLTAKYQLSVVQSLDFGPSRAAVTSFTLVRRFDTFAFSAQIYHDGINNTNGFNVNFFPAGQPGFSAPWGAND